MFVLLFLDVFEDDDFVVVVVVVVIAVGAAAADNPATANTAAAPSRNINLITTDNGINMFLVHRRR